MSRLQTELLDQSLDSCVRNAEFVVTFASGPELTIASSADCAGPRVFSLELMMTVSGESWLISPISPPLMAPRPRGAG